MRTPLHAALDHLQSIDMPLDGPVAVILPQGLSYRSIVSPDARHEVLHLAHLAGFDLQQPRRQGLCLPLLHHLLEGLGEPIGEGDLGLGLTQHPHEGLVLRVPVVGGSDEQPGCLPRRDMAAAEPGRGG